MASIFLRRPEQQVLSPCPQIGAPAPECLAGHDFLVAFLRHVGCPFAENTIRQLRQWHAQNPQTAVVVVSHGSTAVTEDWLARIGGIGTLRFVNDEPRTHYGRWGLGYTSAWHFMGPRSLSGVMRLWPEGIFNRTASGTRWQSAGMFLVREGRIVWRHIPVSAEEFQLPGVVDAVS